MIPKLANELCVEFDLLITLIENIKDGVSEFVGLYGKVLESHKINNHALNILKEFGLCCGRI